jgi:hypothetical protein
MRRLYGPIPDQEFSQLAKYAGHEAALDQLEHRSTELPPTHSAPYRESIAALRVLNVRTLLAGRP